MGRVFEALDLEGERTVAVKVMLAGADVDLHGLLRFQQEGAVLSKLKHPNIVAVYGSFMEEDSCSIAMELIDGRPLGDIMRSEQLSLPRITVIAQQVLSALAYAHSRGIVHRDVKPDNIMVGEGDRVKVTDFGIARILVPGSTLNTRTGSVIGTPLYMSPEQIEGRGVDGRSDLYSFGTVLYQMLVGRPPFEGDDPLTVAFQHVHKAPQPPSELSSEVPDGWERIVLQALAKFPADRFQTADAMGGAVARLGTETVKRPRDSSKPDTVQRVATAENSPPPVPAVEPDPRVVPAPYRTPPPSPATARSVTIPIPGGRWLAGTGLFALVLVLLVLMLLVVLLVRDITSTKSGVSTAPAAHGLPTRFLTSWGGVGGGPGHLTAPAAVAIDSANLIYVADYNNNRISVFSSAGRALHQWAFRDPKTGTYLSASGVAVRGTTVYAVDPNGGRVLTLTAGKVVAAWRGRALRSPSSVAVGSDGTVYVVDQGNNRVQELSPAGTVLRVFGSAGGAPGQFNFPTSVAIAPDGTVLVADPGNYRIQRFSKEGKFVAAWGQAGRGRSQFQAVAGLAAGPDGTVYVTDSQLARVQAFTPRGKLLAVWGARGRGRRDLRQPVGIALDVHGNAYVVDSANDRIVKFGPRR